MTKQCPNCETELANQEETCPNCGRKMDNKAKKAASTDTKEANNQSKTDTKQATSNFTSNEQNENIEWSELKDMSLGHVMNMFNEQQINDDSSEHKDQVKQSIEEATTQKNEENQHNEKEIENSTEDSTIDKSALNQYINAHKTEENQLEEETIAEVLIETDVEQITETDEELLADEPISVVEAKEADINQIKSENDVTTKQTIINHEETAIEETPLIGPKALPKASTDEIPSKSKKPEEIEMDAAPIFFKEDHEEEPPQSRSLFDELKEKNNSEKESSKPSSIENKPKNYKKMAILLASVIVLAGGSWAIYSQMNSMNDSTKIAASEQEEATKVKDDLSNYYTSSQHEFIKPEMVDVSTAAIKEKLTGLKDTSSYKELSTLYTDVTEKQQAIQQVNALFTQPIINGDQLTDAALKEDKSVAIRESSETDNFHQLINEAISQANTQYDQLQKAKSAVAVFYKDDTLTEALTRATYDSAKAEVDKVKNETLREPLTAILTKANAALAEQEAAAQQAAATQVPQETASTPQPATTEQAQTNGAATGQQPDSSGFSAPNADGVYTSPVYTAVASDVADTSNPAWVWAPGVKEQVLATCIARGYITAGAYSLEPARIINGEGYYNLYNNQGQYQVTINAQTGWFKGNASRNAGR